MGAVDLVGGYIHGGDKDIMAVGGFWSSPAKLVISAYSWPYLLEDVLRG